MTDFAAKVRVVLTAAVTYLTLAVTVITIFAEEIASVLPEGVAETVGMYGVTAVAWITVAISIIRRVSPVLPEERGILPQ